MHGVVVGTGPAATACAKALVRRGARVTVMDVGDSLDPEREALAAELASTPPQRWDRAAMARAIDNPTIGTLPIPRKLLFGSDYFYAADRPYWPIQAKGVAAAPSFARGGYSVAWGAAMLPADDCDMQDWPITRKDLEPSYRRVLKDLPLSAREDRLAENFPLYRDNVGALGLPAQLRDLDRDLSRLPHAASDNPLLHGQARLAVRTTDAPDGQGCKYCGICLSGCPYGAIYTTRDEAAKLAARGALELVSRAVVLEVREGDQGVELVYQDLATRTVQRRSFDRAFIGAGTINSTRILLRSLKLFDTPVRLKDSQKFVLPFLRFGSTPIEWPAINSLAGLFVETKLRSLSAHWIHLQISTVNDYLLKRFRLDPFDRASAASRLLQPALSRLMIAWSSLHSDHSSQIELELRAPRAGAEPVLGMRNVINPEAGRNVRRASWALARAGLRFRSIFLSPFVQMSPPGSGGHCGGSFPMRDAPGAGTWSDLLGRPMGMKRVHLVDASVFPSIPGTTIVLPIMANADRIATQAPLD